MDLAVAALEGAIRMKRIMRLVLGVFFLCAFLCFLSVGMAEREIPDVLRVTQEIVLKRMDQHRILTTSVLHSVREEVNAAIDARVAALAEEAEPLIPAGKTDKPGRADVCTQITRVGERWMSFHICAQVSGNNRQFWVKSEEYTYDMEAGQLILLGEIIREEGWETLLREVRDQVTALFPEDEPMDDALNALCSRESLMESGFVITPGHLALYFPAAEVYPSHAEALLRVEIYVPGLLDILTEEARRETDCTGYELVALTYDDGPGKGTTRNVLNASVQTPGQVTFFTIGKRLEKNAELLHREFDAGHSIQSHTMQHVMKGIKANKLEKWEMEFNQAMGRIIGTVPVMMRPPGGYWKAYINAGSQLPMIMWSINSQDASDTTGDSDKDMYACYSCALSAKDGDIVLFHDMKSFAGKLAEKCMKRFEEKNMLLVTLNDLFALRGVSAGAGMTIYSCPPEE